MDYSDGYLYLPGQSLLYILDVDPPSTPEVVSTYPIDHVGDVSIDGDLAFVARGYFLEGPSDTAGNGLHILDISNPLTPEEVGSYRSWGATAVEKAGSYAYVTTANYTHLPGYSGFAIVDVSNPEQPRQLSRLDTLGQGASLAVSGVWAYASRDGIQVISTVNPLSPRIVATIDGGMVVSVCGIDEQMDVLLVGTYRSPGISVYRNSIVLKIERRDRTIPSEFTLHQNYPNPFNRSTRVEYDIARKGRVVLDIFGVTGEKTLTLVDENKDPGSYTVFWDGLDDNGETAANGLYLYRLHTNLFTEARKMLLLK